MSFLRYVAQSFPVIAAALETLAVEWATIQGKDPTSLIEALTSPTKRESVADVQRRKYDSERPTKPGSDDKL